MTHFRLIALCAITLISAWASQALAQRLGSDLVRLEPGYGGVCEGCDLSGRILAGARMSRSVFDRSDFSNAILAQADATGSRFEDANFSGADLRQTTFDGAMLSGALLENANLSGADFSDAEGLTQRQLNLACGDDDTLLPEGLHVRSCAP